MTKDAARRNGASRLRSALVVDDATELRALYGGLLEQRSGLDVVATADDGRSAIEAAHEHPPDLVLLDLSMPELDGLDALPRIAAASPDSVIVVLSGFLADEFRDEALSRGATGYVEKTGEPERFLPRLQRALRGEGRLPGFDDVRHTPAVEEDPPQAPEPARTREEGIA